VNAAASPGWLVTGDLVVADHDRVWARHQTITDPEHLAAARHCAESG
jgi:hypothetical protein